MKKGMIQKAGLPKKASTPQGSRARKMLANASVDATSRPAGGASEPSPMPRWTFLTNHAHVLIMLHAEPGIILREVADRVGITERAVQRILHDLEQDGFVKREKVGRQNQYEVVINKPLRHPIEAHRQIGDLLKLILRRDER